MKAKDLYRMMLKLSVSLFGVAFTKKLDARLRFGRKLNLKNPVTLADKLCYLELFVDDSLKAKCSDKYAVREYVADKGLADILVPLCHDVCTETSEIDFESLPKQFAMKATHGCGMNLICDDKDALRREQVMETAAKWLREDYARACIEPHYQKIPHRILFEEFLQDGDRIIDYKFHCIHGVPDFVLVCSNRRSGVKLNTYTPDWEPLDILVEEEKSATEIARPRQLARMIEISRKLSADFDFVRVDLYEINGKIYFGELTFTPATGVLPSFTEAFLAEKGKLLHLKQGIYTSSC